MPVLQRRRSSERVAQRTLRARKVAANQVMSHKVAMRWVASRGKSPNPDGAKQLFHDYSALHPATTLKWEDFLEETGKGKPDEKPDRKGLFKAAIKSVLISAKGASKAMVASVKQLPDKAQQFIVDPQYRKEQSDVMASSLRKNSKHIAKRVWQAFKDETHATFIESPKIVASLIGEGRLPTKSEAKTLYGTAVYIGGVALSGPGMSLGTAFAAKGGAAFAHSFSLHVAVKTLSYMADDKFLFYEALETGVGGGEVAEGAGGLSSFLKSIMPETGDLYSMSPFSLLKGISSIVTGSKKDGPENSGDHDEAMAEFARKFVKTMSRVMEDGFTDDDLVSILQEKYT